MDLIEVARVKKQMKQISLEKSETNIRLEAEIKAKQEQEGEKYSLEKWYTQCRVAKDLGQHWVLKMRKSNELEKVFDFILLLVVKIFCYL